MEKKTEQAKQQCSDFGKQNHCGTEKWDGCQFSEECDAVKVGPCEA
jgi:hypothetical protein